ncbi:threonine-rich protein-like [Branchiostoma lanceolatum]|uniref:threonine-rich protein-like n=1 Tax=Branchiostoma lanceolatum TaxID=7740 RepID=UPI003456A7DF
MAFSAGWCILLVVFIVDPTSALTCYTCNALEGGSNSTDFTSCLYDPTSASNQTCLPSEDTCQSVLVELSWLRVIERRCANSSVCASIQNSTSATGSQCCGTDLCNVELVPTTLAPTTTTKPTTVVTTVTTTTPTTTTFVTTTTPSSTTNAPTAGDRYLVYIVVMGVLAGLLLIMTIVAICFCVKYRKTVNKTNPIIQVREYEPENNNQNTNTSFSDIKSTKFDYAYRPYVP